MRRLALICCALAAFAASQLATAPAANAFGCEHFHRGSLDDCYGYRPAHRGYYPYYNSGQWRSAKEMRWKRRHARLHFRYPQYNPAWGHPVDNYNHYEFHSRDGHRHRLGHW
jgi:hypothetical protein